MRSVVGVRSEPPRAARPGLYVSPMPGRPAADSPAWLRKPQPADAPLVDCFSSDAQSLCDLYDSDWVIHVGHCRQSVDSQLPTVGTMPTADEVAPALRQQPGAWP